MRHIKTRKKARIINKMDHVIAAVFSTFAVMAGGWMFMTWYFISTPTWLMLIGEAAAIGLFSLGIALWENAEIEASRFWDREEGF